MKVNFEPMPDYILVDPTPDSGKIVAIGEDVQFLKVGDTVMFPKQAGPDLIVDGKSYIIMNVSQVYGVYGG